ncbi:MAG: ABC transporter ATP-binding protein [Burkholderiales bacterium]|nr:ABC transporter ATP-binding protein [Burkholderiales bacterium]NCV84346.1 ABC transporter ATP-binding protein [Oxalobacteraceae bacterium]NCW84878.1 ABC transporter ATP-binding protein [Oxalobacteraceae bacterium]NDG06369.1 ABC transporter ATP-binding protein [Oxalobacteraceae bacterium]
MHLELQGVTRKVGAETHLYTSSVSLAPGAINVLLGPTLSGKTTLMRLIAGLDKPSEGRVIADGVDVTGVPVRERHLAMVYQQFINYPSMSVFENIASPLRIAGKLSEQQIHDRVHAMAERLHISAYLDRSPSALSGGQQQRCALARALIKEAGLLLLDEPLVNLDYKLREELRRELSDLFSTGSTTVVYATTEPLEALQLGGQTLLMHEGRVLQQGATLSVFSQPCSVVAARTFSDPPINLFEASVTDGVAQLSQDIRIPLGADQQSRIAGQRHVQLGLRAHSLHANPRENGFALTCSVDLAEISGSETFVHLKRGALSLVAQLPGVHDLSLGSESTMHFQPSDMFIFSADGALMYAPEA